MQHLAGMDHHEPSKLDAQELAVALDQIGQRGIVPTAWLSRYLWWRNRCVGVDRSSLIWLIRLIRRHPALPIQLPETSKHLPNDLANVLRRSVEFATQCRRACKPLPKTAESIM